MPCTVYWILRKFCNGWCKREHVISNTLKTFKLYILAKILVFHIDLNLRLDI